MSVLHAIQPSFAAGELAPALHGRVDFAKYSSGLKTARNSFIHPTGGWSNRPGFLYVAATKYSDKECILIPFIFSTTQAYMLEVGDQYIRFHKNGAPILSGGVPYEVATPYLEADLPLLKWTQSADTIYLAHSDYAPMTLVRSADTNWTLAAFEFENGPYSPRNTNQSSLITLTLPNHNGTGTLTGGGGFLPEYVGGWWEVTTDVNPETKSATVSSAGATYSDSLLSYKRWRLSTTGTWTGTIFVQMYADQNRVTPALSIATFSSNNDANFNSDGNIPSDVPVWIVLKIALTSGAITYNLTADAFTFSYNFKITSYNNINSVNVSSSHIQNGMSTGYVDLPATSTSDWAQGAWMADIWPSVVSFYQDRLVWARTTTQWFSQSGDYENYGVSDPLVDSDAISVDLPSRQLNAIQNLVPLTSLLALTSSSEFSVSPGASGIFSPASIDQRAQGYRGSSSVNAVVIGNQAIYVQPMGTVIRSIGYQYASDSFTGDNLSLLASHLFENYEITCLAYQQEPYSLVWAVRDDGELLCMTYMPEQQVVAWTHNDTDGTFESISCIPADGYDELWAVVNRDNGRFIERMAQRLPTTNPEDQNHLDCSITYVGASTSVLAGLDHLEGKAVTVNADGSQQGPFTVVSGQITLTTPVTKAIIGLPFISDFETLSPEIQRKDGTSQGRKARVSQVTIKFLNSKGGFVGPNSSKLREIIQRTSTTDPVPLETWDYQVPVSASFEDNGRIFYRQTSPFPVTILGVIPQLVLGEL